MQVSIIVFLAAVSFYIFLQGCNVLKGLTADVHFSGLFNREEESGTEIPMTETTKPKYDIVAFKKRIETLKDDDGLFDVIDLPPVTDFTGTEVITDQTEMDLDRYIGSR